MDYSLIDSGNCCKIEKFGEVILSRPCDVAVWPLGKKVECHASFNRKRNDFTWSKNKTVPKSWIINVKGQVKAILKATQFGHVGIFHEHSELWDMHKNLYDKIGNPSILNLFAYTGVGTIKMAKDNCFVTHVDSSKASINWANENSRLNDVSNDKIRWILEDVMKFMRKESRRGKKYDAIILDPPSFGRGTKNEVFKLENDLWELITLCKQCLAKKSNAFITLSSHSEGFSEHMLAIILKKTFKNSCEFSLKKGTLNLGSKDKEIPVGYFSTIILN